MTVEDLIYELQKLPMDARVVVLDDGEVEHYIDPSPRECDFGSYNLFEEDTYDEIRDGRGRNYDLYIRL